MSLTPCVALPMIDISDAFSLFAFPTDDNKITSGSLSTWKAFTIFPVFSVIFRVVTPLPPLEVSLYFSTSVLLPKPFSVIVNI